MDDQQFLVLTDRGCYSDYGIQAYICDAAAAKRLAAAHERLGTIIREKRFRAPEHHGYTQIESKQESAITYLDYNHEDVRLIIEIVGTPLRDDILESKEAVEALIEMYEQHIARATLITGD